MRQVSDSGRVCLQIDQRRAKSLWVGAVGEDFRGQEILLDLDRAKLGDIFINLLKISLANSLSSC